jgi:CheY-like chemotaxis protein
MAFDVPSILIVDDDADIRTLLRELLSAEEYVVHVARDGHHALRVLEKLDIPSLILLDYKMPVMDGKQFLTALRQIPRLKAVPVIILSAHTREWSGARLEVADILFKPVDADLLLSTVARVCSIATTAPPRSGG